MGFMRFSSISLDGRNDTFRVYSTAQIAKRNVLYNRQRNSLSCNSLPSWEIMLRSPWPDEGYQCNISQDFFYCKYVEINNSNEYSLETFLVCIKVIDTYVWHAKFKFATARIISIWLIFTVRLINSLRPSDAYMRRQSKSLVPIMACRLVGSKPLPATLMVYCQLIVIFIQENALECVVCQNGGHFVRGS